MFARPSILLRLLSERAAAFAASNRTVAKVCLPFITNID